MRNSELSLLGLSRNIKSCIKKTQLALLSVSCRVSHTEVPWETGPLKRH